MLSCESNSIQQTQKSMFVQLIWEVQLYATLPHNGIFLQTQCRFTMQSIITYDNKTVINSEHPRKV